MIETNTPPINNDFVANWPTSLAPSSGDTTWKVIYLMISILIPVIGLCRLIGMALDKWVITHLIVYSASRSEEKKAEIHDHREQNILSENTFEISFKTPDGETLDAIYYPALNRDDNLDKKCVVHFSGNADSVEGSHDRLEHLIDKGDVAVLLVNPRGVGKSTGTPTALGLKLDAYTAMQFVHHHLRKLPIVGGHSLGGGYGLEGAKLFQEMHPELPVSAYADRTFATLSDAVKGLSPCGLKSVAAGIVWLNGWALDPLSAIETLQGHTLATYHVDDSVIPLSSSLGAALTPKEHRTIYEVPRIKDETGHEAHCRSLNLNYDKIFMQFIQDAPLTIS